MSERGPGASRTAVLGLDLGTTEAKAALVGLDGTLYGLGRAAIPTFHGPDGRAEQDPRDWWRAIASATRSIEALGGRGASWSPRSAASARDRRSRSLDGDAEPTRAAITWQDRRIGGGGWGLLPKIAWLADNDLDAAAEARWLLASWDALGLWLTGEAAQTLQGHETAMGARDLEAAGVRRAQTGDPLPFGTPLGALRADAASALGIRPGIPVVAGVNDGTASMLGAGPPRWRATRSTPAGRRAASASTRTARWRSRACSSHPRRSRAAGSSAAPWRRPAPRWTGSGR